MFFFLYFCVKKVEIRDERWNKFDIVKCDKIVDRYLFVVDVECCLLKCKVF